MNWDQDQDGNAIYAHNLSRRIETNRAAPPDEMVIRSNVSALTRQFNALVIEFERGGTVDPKQIDLLGVQIAANVGTANELRAGVPILALAS